MARDALFDLAVARALNYSQSLGIDLLEEKLEEKLEPWYKRTRFAYRIPLRNISKSLKSYPGDGFSWQGGEKGKWQKS
ncbi:MAG: hypothetical protein KC422_20510 [Trueperaceae bacterium]|nr:hypothetical protein [Trueperaceae bacterium]